MCPKDADGIENSVDPDQTAPFKVTLFGTRFTHAAESRYAPVEGEDLAVADAHDKARYFVLVWENVLVAVDHKPLLKLISDRSLEDISNTRLRNLKEKTLRYRYKMVYVPGIKHRAADGISRHPTGEPLKMTIPDHIAYIKHECPDSAYSLQSLAFLTAGNTLHTNDVNNQVIFSVASSLNSQGLNAVTWEMVRIATASNSTMHCLVELIESGMPEFRHEFPETLCVRDDLYTVNGVVLYKNRIVIPLSLRQDVLTVLHSAHQGVTSMNSRAEASVFWLDITPVFIAVHAGCSYCNRMMPSKPSAPPTPLVTTDNSFQCLLCSLLSLQGCQLPCRSG